jgi:hypothetical protein
VKPTSSPQDEEIIELLKRLGTLKAEYPAELLAARRAAFAAQIEQQKSKGASEGKTLSQEQVLELLESLKPAQAEYPPALLAARRASFISQIEQREVGPGRLSCRMVVGPAGSIHRKDQTNQQRAGARRIAIPGPGDGASEDIKVGARRISFRITIGPASGFPRTDRAV